MINGLKNLTFGVEDLNKAKDYLFDFGLDAAAEQYADSLHYALPNGSTVQVFESDHPDLPPAFESGSTLREVTWAVNRPQDLQQLALNLQGQPGYAFDGTVLRCIDPNGMSLRFEVAQLGIATQALSPAINQYGHIQRVNEASPVYEKANPVAIGHVVFFTPDLEAVQAFYEEKLGFYLSDAYTDRGAFLRCSAQGWHHDLFLLKLPNREQAGLNHVAFVVRDIHEVIGGGLNMNKNRWDSFIGPGRHPVSSAYFWYIHSPLGGAFEYYTNDDYLTAAWQPRHFDYALELFTEWAIDKGIDPTTRRQISSQ
ncbi:MAG TPA: VOC family protein [Paenalcaligenes hominis]|uniref:Catechol 2,3-dioxygenase-like lactoylglutathione lyase family enzyme n=1 Tax=Paenalcaligenes hominis TaxID=643674 RepID=A0A9D3AB38_9BURK|nr:VOC family protein [Paenalcaligenes hominis]NJB65517.1 catechol 2,3-dioxygenase-like lactoylglutathione lyase family enzyme [Paenalcaligenes hominis]GGE65228.1 glyoxalase [Paenalcaligenes hominis]HJH24321.1 VOC family protein [Paenalcaligenes hominis]